MKRNKAKAVVPITVQTLLIVMEMIPTLAAASDRNEYTIIKIKLLINIISAAPKIKHKCSHVQNNTILIYVY